ncbi:Piso0_005730 [Millerozyma farinosa CBS 7064]|uniref:Piso0_005730 protein n=1 Tax=Pichia sorbitophila (strain ATCC MYA-4447 / BCRC 22081 / CBS 7064 / NBRC 10061 / NRRL Y-12695) TaxID=559304 RepID=G8Y2S0_PICSO|nr:Piso0_005730 [Millerozyma farinosa CBS 7064]
MEHNRHQVKYPDISKLKEKYSPQRRLKSPSRGGSEEFSKNYKIFAKAPQRSLSDVKLERPHSSDLAVKNSTNGGRGYGEPNSSPRKTLSSENIRPLHLGVDHSPVRTSGSPVRRKRIADLDHPEAHHTTAQQVSDSHVRLKKQKVSFDDRVEVDRSMSAELKADQTSSTEMPTDSKGGDVGNNTNDNEIPTTLHRLEVSLSEIHQRLDYIESRQITLEKFIHIYKPTSNLADRVEQLEKKLENANPTPADDDQNI